MELWLQRNDPSIVHELYKKARAKGRSSKEFIEFASSIFDYWQKFYDTAVELDIRDKETSRELIELRQQLAQKPSVDVLDAKRYRYMKSILEVPNATQSFLKHHNMIPATFKGGIDESIDKAMSEAKPINESVK